MTPLAQTTAPRVPELPIDVLRLILHHLGAPSPASVGCSDASSATNVRDLEPSARSQQPTARRGPTRTGALAACMRTSKLIATLAAPLLYRSIHLRGLGAVNGGEERQLMVDAGARADLLELDHLDAPTEAGDEGTVRSRESRSAEDGAGVGVRGATLKQRLLRLTTHLKVELGAEDFVRLGQTGGTLPVAAEMCSLPNLDTITLCLLEGFDHPEMGPATTDPAIPSSSTVPALRHLAPRHLTIDGVSLYQRTSLSAILPADIRLTSVDIFIRGETAYFAFVHPNGPPEAGAESGLPLVLSDLTPAIGSSAPARSTTIIARQNPDAVDAARLRGQRSSRRTISVPTPGPHAGMITTMEFHPDYAPGWMGSITRVLGPHVLRAVQIGEDAHPWSSGQARTSFGSTSGSGSGSGSYSPRPRSSITFVGFGLYDGETLGMPQAAESEVQDRFERSLRVHLTRALARYEAERERERQRHAAEVHGREFDPAVAVVRALPAPAGGIFAASDRERAKLRRHQEAARSVRVISTEEWEKERMQA